MSSGGVWRPARRAEVRTIQFAGDGVAMRDEWQQAARARREEQREAAVQALAPRENGSSADVLRAAVVADTPVGGQRYMFNFGGILGGVAARIQPAVGGVANVVGGQGEDSTVLDAQQRSRFGALLGRGQALLGGVSGQVSAAASNLFGARAAGVAGEHVAGIGGGNAGILARLRLQAAAGAGNQLQIAAGAQPDDAAGEGDDAVLARLRREDEAALGAMDVEAAVLRAVQQLPVPAEADRHTSDKLRAIVEIVTRQWFHFLDEEDGNVAEQLRVAALRVLLYNFL